jgi:ATP-dependent DNA helicase RecG
MQPYSVAELERLLADLESDLVERKETFKGDAPVKVREAVCAFANDLPNHGRPGVVFIGAKDDGSPTGLEVTDELLRQLADIKTDGQIVPPPTLTVSPHTLRGGQMAVIAVWPADSPPVRYKGRIFIRTGPRRDIASAQDERILNEKRRHRDRPYDVRPVAGTTLDDLDLPRFETEYLRAAVAPELLAANDRTREQRLAATKMIASADDPNPTVLGLLVIGKDPRRFLPGAYVQFLRIQGNSLADPVVDEAVLDGPVADLLRRLDEKLATHNRTRVDFTSGPREQRHDLYPLIALRQLTRNAVMHRAYEGTNAPARVHWFDDRIEIISPGGPYGEVTLHNFGTPGITDYRNPNLAEALRVLGFVQKFGGGIATARHAMQRNGNPPIEFRLDPGYVLAVLHPAP